MNEEEFKELTTAYEMLVGIVVKLGERVEHIEKYVQTVPTPDKVLYRPKDTEEYLNIKENYDLIYKRLEVLENGMQGSK